MDYSQTDLLAKRPLEIVATNSYQKNYKYTLEEKPGDNFDELFKPELSPKEMIDLGIFGGKYESVNKNEFPDDWFEKNNLNSHEKDPTKNFFEINASQPLSVWRSKGWIYGDDPQGWFLWYCRYYMGRRIMPEDERQIKRWKAMTRHIAQVKKNCFQGDLSCRTRQRQALLHWAYDSRNY